MRSNTNSENMRFFGGLSAHQLVGVSYFWAARGATGWIPLTDTFPTIASHALLHFSPFSISFSWKRKYQNSFQRPSGTLRADVLLLLRAKPCGTSLPLPLLPAPKEEGGTAVW